MRLMVTIHAPASPDPAEERVQCRFAAILEKASARAQQWLTRLERTDARRARECHARLEAAGIVLPTRDGAKAQ